MTRLALHACCGPCLLEPLDAYRAEFGEVTVIYANSNIHPAEEYGLRRSTLESYARQAELRVLEAPYDPERWMREVGPLADAGAARCRACYAFRLRETAELAAHEGFDALATTLTVSPYQDPDAIRAEGERACASAGLEYVHRDFRDRYPEATRRSRELGMYRQNYCGCIFSKAEAEAARERRRAERAKARADKP
ncbi:MAG: epoxyqueuosine reductase QueH [Coriobacteriia bacterium]